MTATFASLLILSQAGQLPTIDSVWDAIGIRKPAEPHRVWDPVGYRGTKQPPRVLQEWVYGDRLSLRVNPRNGAVHSLQTYEPLMVALEKPKAGRARSDLAAKERAQRFFATVRPKSERWGMTLGRWRGGAAHGGSYYQALFQLTHVGNEPVGPGEVRGYAEVLRESGVVSGFLLGTYTVGNVIDNVGEARARRIAEAHTFRLTRTRRERGNVVRLERYLVRDHRIRKSETDGSPIPLTLAWVATYEHHGKHIKLDAKNGELILEDQFRRAEPL